MCSIIEIVRELFCRHNYKIIRWRWLRFYIGGNNHIDIIESMLECKKCGKIKYKYPKPNSKDELKYINELYHLYRV